MEKDDPKTTNNIIKARKSIKQKLLALKRDEQLIEKSFAPITTPLRVIADKIKTPDTNAIDIKSENDEPEKKKKEEDKESVKSNEEFQSMSESEASTNGDEEYLSKLNDLPRSYISGLIHDTKDAFDTKYGVRYHPEEDNFYIGNSEIKFIDDHILINNNEYEATQGLFELMFKKQPRNIYSSDDEENYIKIINDTSAHKQSYDSSRVVSGAKSWKYKNIIKPLMERQREQHGGGELMMNVNDNAIDYVFWDNANELVDRLRLLKASQRAGNSNHTNEINSILEELMEAKLIAPIN